MGYRDDFYTQANIIGYTGTLGSDPSVYFKRVTPNGVEWGRITQAHDTASNVGRALVRKNTHYDIRNVGEGAKRSAVEFVNGNRHHQSRNVFLPVTDGTRAALAQAIAAFPDLRPRHARYLHYGAADLGAQITAGGAWEI